MAVTTPCLCSREDAQRAIDFKDAPGTVRAQVDRAIQDAARTIEGRLHRKFHPLDATRYFPWPNYQYAFPWRIWFDQHDLIVATAVTAGTVAIGLDKVFLEPVNSGPPFQWLELDRSSTAAFGGNAATPQHSTVITGTWGYSADTDAAGTLAAAITTTTQTAVTVSDASLVGVGDLLIVGAGTGVAPFPASLGYAGALVPLTGERLLVSDRATATTGQTNLSGAATASAADNVIGVTDGTQVHAGEVLTLDAERMLIQFITGNNVTVKRAWDGTVLATHSLGTTLYADRLLTVLRGQQGTTAATWLINAALVRHRPPSLIRDLAIAESASQVLQETSGYARQAGEGQALRAVIGPGVPDLWDKATTAYGRKMRMRVA